MTRRVVMSAIPAELEFTNLEIERDRDQFLRELLSELSGVLETVVGLENASGFISMVGARMGDAMNAEYCAALGHDVLSVEEVAAALVDLKLRIKGGFSIETLDTDKIVLVNNRCPFGEYVKGRPSLCMMTSNVFGRIAAENLGYAEVMITEAIARGDRRCRVVVSLIPNALEARDSECREYYGSD
jgi:predicted ArsR family transcriptional regulator